MAGQRRAGRDRARLTDSALLERAAAGLDAKTADLRELISTANALLRDLRTERREFRQEYQAKSEALAVYAEELDRDATAAVREAMQALDGYAERTVADVRAAFDAQLDRMTSLAGGNTWDELTDALQQHATRGLALTLIQVLEPDIQAAFTAAGKIPAKTQLEIANRVVWLLACGTDAELDLTDLPAAPAGAGATWPGAVSALAARTAHRGLYPSPGSTPP